MKDTERERGIEGKRKGGERERERERESELSNLPALNEVHCDPVFMKQLNLSQHNSQCCHKVL